MEIDHWENESGAVPKRIAYEISIDGRNWSPCSNELGFLIWNAPLGEIQEMHNMPDGYPCNAFMRKVLTDH